MALPNDQKRLYKDLAWLWPIFSTPEEYAPDTKEFVCIIKENSGIEVRTVLHLGCGGGLIDLTLKKYFRVTGIDLSPRMLRQARKPNPEVAYAKGDMRSLRLKEKFDAIVAPDSIDYLTSKRDIKKTIRVAYDHLRPGGIFLIVIEHTKETFKQNDNVLTARRAKTVRLTALENLFDPDPRDTTYESTFVYLIRRGRKLRVETDRHLCGLFPVKTWENMIREAGFRVNTQNYIARPTETGSYPMFIRQKPGR